MTYSDDFIKTCEAASFDPMTGEYTEAQVILEEVDTITQKLQDFAFTFDNYLELDADGFVAESEDLKGFWTEYADEFTDDQEDLYEIAFALEQDAAYYFEAEIRQSELDEELDQRQHEDSRRFN